MNVALRQHAARDENVFHFVSTHQTTNDRQGCTRMRELARLWWRIHSSTKHAMASTTDSYVPQPQYAA
ncbi:MAG: hypothetical protein QGG42_11360 [Phycisphaerae bacterium]|nr:hypothetical protein [Phycisphaerae bacterium]